MFYFDSYLRKDPGQTKSFRGIFSNLRINQELFSSHFQDDLPLIMDLRIRKDMLQIFCDFEDLDIRVKLGNQPFERLIEKQINIPLAPSRIKVVFSDYLMVVKLKRVDPDTLCSVCLNHVLN